MFNRKLKSISIFSGALVIVAYQNCGKNSATDASADKLPPQSQEASLQDYYINVTPASKVGTYTVLEESCQKLELQTVNKERATPFLNEVKTHASIEVALEKHFTDSGKPNYSAFETRTSYQSLKDCEQEINGSPSFIYESTHEKSYLHRWIRVNPKESLPEGKNYITVRVVNLGDLNPNESSHSSSFTLVEITEPVLSLVGPRLVTKDECIPYKVNYSNFSGQNYPLGDRGYYFSNYSANKKLNYEAFSDENCTQSILNVKNNQALTIYIKFYSEPLEERANPTIVHVTPEIKIKVGSLIVWTNR